MLLKYLKTLLPLTLGVEGENDVDVQINDAEGVLETFPTDEQTMALFVLKQMSPETADSPSSSSPSQSSSFSVHTELQKYEKNHVSWLAMIKRHPVLDVNQPLGQQLQLVNLPCGVIYETLHSYVRNAFTPFFNVTLNSTNNDKLDKSEKLVAKKKLAELELSLLHLQQNVEIPQVSLIIHPTIQKAISQAKASGKRATVDLLDEKTLSDPLFLNQIQSDVNSWVKEIQKVTRLSREVASGTASQEVNFWIGLEKELERIEQTLKSDQVSLVMDVLKHAKRFHATTSFMADTGLKESMETAQKYNVLMKDFPVAELLSASDSDKIQEALVMIFSHVTKKLRLSPYPVKRALDLMEAISSDLNQQLIRLLSARKLMHLDYEEFNGIMLKLASVFETWERQMKEFANCAREIVRKRAEKFIPIKVNQTHAKLQERLEFIWGFRRQHFQLRDTIAKISDDISINDVDEAYECVRGVNVLDCGEDGTEIWAAGESSYNYRVSRVENQIIMRLRDRLAASKNAAEMFSVFSRYNSLFIRPKVSYNKLI